MRETFSRVAASLIRMLCLAPMPVPTATAVGVASPSASGQAITTAETANVMRHDGSGATQEVPGEERDDARADGQDHQVLRGPVGQPLAGRLGVLRLLDQVHDLGERGVRADLGGAEAHAAAAVDRARDHRVPGRFVTGTLSPVTRPRRCWSRPR